MRSILTIPTRILALCVALLGCDADPAAEHVGTPAINEGHAGTVASQPVIAAAPEVTTHEHPLVLQPHEHAEVELEMPDGASARVSFRADSVVSWDLHAHTGRQLQYFRSARETEMDVVFEAPRSGVYFLALHNDSDLPVAISIKLTVHPDVVVRGLD